MAHPLLQALMAAAGPSMSVSPPMTAPGTMGTKLSSIVTELNEVENEFQRVETIVRTEAVKASRKRMLDQGIPKALVDTYPTEDEVDQFVSANAKISAHIAALKELGRQQSRRREEFSVRQAARETHKIKLGKHHCTHCKGKPTKCGCKQGCIGQDEAGVKRGRCFHHCEHCRGMAMQSCACTHGCRKANGERALCIAPQ